MVIRSRLSIPRAALLAAAFCFAPFVATVAGAQLNESCLVSALNRTVQVDSEGVWVLPNVPTNMGVVRARATCTENGVTRFGQSDFFVVPPDDVIEVSQISFDVLEPVPDLLTLSVPSALEGVGATAQISASAVFSDGSTTDVTLATAGTTYAISNPSVATISADGLVTAVASGVVLITAINEGTLAVERLEVSTSADSDGDGLPDDWEIANGFDPNNPIDALDDQDLDGLSSIDEFNLGTDSLDADSDDDGLEDGEEVGAIGTNPVLFDSDGDQISDGLEIFAGSDPLDAASFNLAPILDGLVVDPVAFTLVFNTALGEVSRKVRVMGHLIDGTEIDVTSRTYGTSYVSTDLSVASFSPDSGRIFAGQDGVATVTVLNASLAATTTVTVESFSPIALSELFVGGEPKALDVVDGMVYIATDRGLTIVDASDPASPMLVATFVPELARIEDVAVRDGIAYLANWGSEQGDLGGLLIVDVSVPSAPVELSRLGGLMYAVGIDVSGPRALLAAWEETYPFTEDAFHVIDIADPAAPRLLSTAPTAGARRVAFAGDLGLVAARSGGLRVFDLSDPAQPVMLGWTATGSNGSSNAADVAVRGQRAVVADGEGRSLGGIRIVDFSEPAAPVVIGASSDNFGSQAVSLDGDLALTADHFFSNAVPIFNVARSQPVFQEVLTFAGFAKGVDVQAEEGLVYMLGRRSSGAVVFIGRYYSMADLAGEAPTVSILTPAPGDEVRERSLVRVRIDAVDDVGVRAVEVYLDGQSVGMASQRPYEVSVEIPSDSGAHALVASAEDFGGNVGSSEPVALNVIPDELPTLRIVAPVAGARAVEGTSLRIVVSASDDVEVASVELLIEGALLARIVDPPYTADYAIPDGSSSLSLMAIATDDSGQTRSAEVVIDILADEPPTAILLEPREGSDLVSGGVIDAMAAGTDDAGLAQVELLVDGQLVGSSSEGTIVVPIAIPFEQSEMVFQARATDIRGQMSLSAPLTLPIIGDPDTIVIGSVEREDGSAVTNAEVTCMGVFGTSGADGSFRIEGVPTALGDIRCTARAIDPGGQILGGRSKVTPAQPGGTTDIGVLTLSLFTGFHYSGAKLETGGPPHSVAIADLNGDGIADVVSSGDRYAFEVVVLLGNADGSFQAPQSYGVGGEPHDFVIADFDEDGDLDVAIANLGQGLTILPGTGDGTFEAPLGYPVAHLATSLASADLDLDGNLDLVLNATVFLGTGSGTFVDNGAVPWTIFPTAVATSDFDGDGVEDLVTSGTSLTVFTGVGDGTFVFGGRIIVVSGQTLDVVAADFDGDGAPDVATIDDRYDELLVFAGHGDLTFEDAQVLVTGAGPRALLVTDVDLGGALDLLVANSGTNDVSVYLGVGDGTFPPALVIPVGVEPDGLVVGDVNGDGLGDLLTANDRAEDISVFYGLGDGSFGTVEREAVGFWPAALALGDANLDGVVDLLVANQDADTVSVLLGRGNGTFLPQQAFATGAGPIGIGVADFDADGLLDVATANSYGDDVTVLFGLGAGELGSPVTMPTGQFVAGLEVADLDGDGWQDLIVAVDDAISVHLGEGGRAFAAAVTYATGSWPFSVSVGDLDGDGALDVVVPNYYDNDLSILLGNGDGTLRPEQRLTLGDFDSFPTSVAIADFDDDGSLDLATSNNGFLAWDISIFLGNGDGSFQAEQRFPAGDNPMGLAVLDANGDGILDLAVTDPYAGYEVSVLLGNGDGTFGQPQGYGAGDCPGWIEAGDLSGDGLDDLVTANQCSDDVSVFIHR